MNFKSKPIPLFVKGFRLYRVCQSSPDFIVNMETDTLSDDEREVR